jgi:predicted nucleic acid-binding protein
MPQSFFDTNILLYSISGVEAEDEKRSRAVSLLGSPSGALSVQVLQEFYVQATRPSAPHPVPHDETVLLISKWMRFEIQEMTLPVLDAALDLRTRTNFSYWDCAVIAAARALGCETLYSEDLSHGRIIDGVQIINPFR